MKVNINLAIYTNEGNLGTNNSEAYLSEIVEHMYKNHALKTGDRVEATLMGNGIKNSILTIDILYSDYSATIVRWDDMEERVLIYDKINHEHHEISKFSNPLQIALFPMDTEEKEHLTSALKKWNEENSMFK